MSIALGPTSHSFISQRLRLHYVDWGNADAPPLILQHGGRDHCRSWDWVAEELRHDWHVIAPDLRGHGDSAWSPDGDYSVFAFLYDFAQLVQSLDYPQVSIIGHSLGANIATRYAGLYPQNVRSFVNIEGLGLSRTMDGQAATTPYADRLRDWIRNKRRAAGRLPRRYPTIEAAYARMKEENAYLTDERASALTRHAVNRNEDGTYSWKFDNYVNVFGVAEFPRAELEALWEAITCPMLLLYGADSFAINPQTSGQISHLSTARVIEYEQAGHWLHHDQFDRFIADVRAFLA